MYQGTVTILKIISNQGYTRLNSKKTFLPIVAAKHLIGMMIFSSEVGERRKAV